MKTLLLYFIPLFFFNISFLIGQAGPIPPGGIWEINANLKGKLISENNSYYNRKDYSLILNSRTNISFSTNKIAHIFPSTNRSNQYREINYLSFTNSCLEKIIISTNVKLHFNSTYITNISNFTQKNVEINGIVRLYKINDFQLITSYCWIISISD
jgi:hypothetical protein